VSLKDLIPSPIKAPLRIVRDAFKSMRRLMGPRAAVCDVRGLKIQLGIESEVEEYRAETYGQREPETLDWIDDSLKDGDVFYDVGANVGVYTLYAALRHPKVTVRSFEPEAQNLASLCRNIALNGLKNVTPCSLALADGKPRLAVLALSRLMTGAALHRFEEEGKSEGEAAFRLGVPCVSLDAFVNDWGAPAPDLIKIDVDGAEEAILKGAEGLLKSGKIRSLLVEVDEGASGNRDRILPYLEGLGYELVREGEPASPPGGQPSRNCIFKKKS